MSTDLHLVSPEPSAYCGWHKPLGPYQLESTSNAALRNTSAEHRISTHKNISAAYVFGLFGETMLSLKASLLAAIGALHATHPRFPTVVMLDEAAYLREFAMVEYLRSLAVTIHPVALVPNVSCTGSHAQGGRLAASFSIARVWSLPYRAVLWLDADAVVLRNLDHLLEVMMATPDIVELRTPQKCRTKLSAASTRDARARTFGGAFNAGVWGLKPDTATAESLVRWLRAPTSPFACSIGFQLAATKSCLPRASNRPIFNPLPPLAAHHASPAGALGICVTACVYVRDFTGSLSRHGAHATRSWCSMSAITCVTPSTHAALTPDLALGST